MAPETRKALESLLRNKFSFLGAERLEINIRISSQPSYRSFGPANERIKADEIWAEIEQEVERLAQ